MPTTTPSSYQQNLINDDWLRTRTWDLWVGQGKEMRLVSTMADLLEYLKVSNRPKSAQDDALRSFLVKPAAEPMPAPLRAEVVEFLGQPQT